MLKRLLLATLLLAGGRVMAKPTWVAMPYLGTWDTGITLGTIPWDDITYIAEAFVLPGYSGATPTYASPGRRANLVSTAHSNNTYAILSIGGASGDNAAWTSSTQPGNVDTFVANIMTLVGTGAQAYDGVDIDWEFPGTGDKTNFTTFMSKLNAALKNSGNANYKGTAFDGSPKKLSFYISPGYFICGVDWNSVGTYVDFAVLPGYDVASGGYEGPIGGTYASTDCRGGAAGSYNQTVSGNLAKLTGGGANQFSFPKSKLVLGMPFYNLAGATLEQTTASGSHSNLNATAMESTWSSGAIVNDSAAFCAKMNWAFGQGFQGVAMWELEQAYPRNGTTEVGKVWDVIGGKDSCITAAGTPTYTPTATRTPTPWVHSVPGRIQAEEYNAYSDSTVANQGDSTLRGDQVDLETSTDTGGGVDVGYITAGEWLEYVVNAGSGGTFSTTFRLASAGTPTLYFHVQVDGVTVGGNVTVAPTGGWQTWASVAGPNLTLGAGQHTLRLVFDTGDYNLNWFDVLSISTPTRTATRTATRTPTRTATPTGTRSATPTLTGSGTASPTASPSPTGSPTRSATPTASGTRTATATATRTATPSVTASVTRTGTATGTASATPTVTPTWTDVPVGSSDTPTPTETLSFTETASASPSGTPTASPSQSPSATVSATATESPSGTASPTVSPSPLGSLTATTTATATDTPGASPSATPSQTPSASATATPSLTLTATGSASPSASPSPAGSATETPSATATPTATGTGTPGPGAAPGPDGPLVIEEILVAPNPLVGDTLSVYVKLEGRAQAIEISLFTPAMVRAAGCTLSGAFAGGGAWNRLKMALPADLAAGFYHVEIRALRGEQRSRSKLGRCYRIRR